jgi:hypothetical protein
MKLFSVRDLSSRFGQPTYDILFDDKTNGCIRCSYRVYDSKTIAQKDVDKYNTSKHNPTEWDKVLTQR